MKFGLSDAAECTWTLLCHLESSPSSRQLESSLSTVQPPPLCLLPLEGAPLPLLATRARSPSPLLATRALLVSCVLYAPGGVLEQASLNSGVKGTNYVTWKHNRMAADADLLAVK